MDDYGIKKVIVKGKIKWKGNKHRLGSLKSPTFFHFCCSILIEYDSNNVVVSTYNPVRNNRAQSSMICSIYNCHYLHSSNNNCIVSLPDKGERHINFRELLIHDSILALAWSYDKNSIGCQIKSPPDMLSKQLTRFFASIRRLIVSHSGLGRQ